MDMNVWTIVSAGLAMSGVFIWIIMSLFRGTREYAEEYGGQIIIAPAIVGLVVFAIGYGICMHKTTSCPNPNCDARIESSFCQECGWEADAAIDCPACEKHFDTDNIPSFCPDCGTELKYEKKHCVECGIPTSNSDKFCGDCGAQLKKR